MCLNGKEVSLLRICNAFVVKHNVSITERNFVYAESVQEQF